MLGDEDKATQTASGFARRYLSPRERVTKIGNRSGTTYLALVRSSTLPNFGSNVSLSPGVIIIESGLEALADKVRREANRHHERNTDVPASLKSSAPAQA